MATLDLSPLSLLLNASSKTVVAELFEDVFACRYQGLTSDRRNRIISDFGLNGQESETEANQLFESIVSLIRATLYSSLDNEQTQALFPEDFHPSLRTLVIKILSARKAEWHEACIESQVSIPKFMGLDWRLDVRSASNDPAASRNAQPIAMVKVKVEGEVTRAGQMPQVQETTLEMDKTTVNTIVNTLSQIRDQLGGLQNQ
mmetsp:Transcript_12635/g.15237  ORF Transcript_12635/g.15237 Transcript_12635/m.15237 type:complete len:202 (-) Transcript_12635:84-689(-)